MDAITLDFVKKYGKSENGKDDRILKFLEENDHSPSFAAVSSDEIKIIVLASLDGEAWVTLNGRGEVIETINECSNYAGASLLKDAIEEDDFGDYTLYTLKKRATITFD
jgi:hypothetical protein